MDTQLELIFNRLLVTALEQNASDLFLFPGQKPLMRTGGSIQGLEKEEILAASFIEQILMRLLRPEQQELYRKNKQIVFSRDLGKNNRVRINVFRQNNLDALSIKLMSNKIISLDQLKLPRIITDFANLHRGVIFISGPRDSGRSTLLAAMIDYLNKNFSYYIVTLEQPIEYIFTSAKSLIEQREVGRDCLSFEDGLNFVRDRNIDVLVVSDVATPHLLLEIFKIAQRGILVFVLMNIDTVYNLIREVIEGADLSKQDLVKFLLGDNLGGVVCTRLVPKIGGGRVLALEIFNGSSTAKSMIKEGRVLQLKNIFQVTEKESSISLDKFLAELVNSDTVLLEEAAKQAIDPEMLKSLIHGSINPS